MELTQSQLDEVKRLKQFYPYRIIYGMIDKDTKQFEAHAVTNMRIPNRLSKQGHEVFTFKVG